MKTLLKSLIIGTLFVAMLGYSQPQPARYPDGTYIPGMVVIYNPQPRWVNCEIVYVDQYGSRPLYFAIPPQSYSSPIYNNYRSWYCG